ncbi:hypothetical protein N9H93_03170 [Rhizobiaceae bacterium]|nr:hypothetical protein [Rhizobiaceae bacterium]
MPKATVDPDNPLACFTHRELLANRAMLRKRGKRGGALLARIETELERRRFARGDAIFAGLTPIPVLDDTGRGKR